MRTKKGIPEVNCPYCCRPAALVKNSTNVYKVGRDFGPVWVCWHCEAWVGCHKGSKRYAPMGRLANAALRKAKQAAHAAFDPLWKAKMRKDGLRKSAARKAAYAWLAAELGIEPKNCHVGYLDVAGCMRVIEVCAPYQAKARAA